MSICSTAAQDPKEDGGWRILDKQWDGHTTFTVEEAAKILRVSRCSAYAAVKAGELPVVWIGRRCIVPRVALERKLANA
jgi:excisionase family DNA binding protein